MASYFERPRRAKFGPGRARARADVAHTGYAAPRTHAANDAAAAAAGPCVRAPVPSLARMRSRPGARLRVRTRVPRFVSLRTTRAGLEHASQARSTTTRFQQKKDGIYTDTIDKKIEFTADKREKHGNTSYPYGYKGIKRNYLSVCND